MPFAIGELTAMAEESPRIFEHVAAVIFEDDQRVLVMPAQEFEEAGLRIEAIAQEDVETAGVVLEHPLEIEVTKFILTR